MYENAFSQIERDLRAEAESVAQALAELGIARDRLKVAAESDRQPVYLETSASGQAGNRRVEIFYEGGGAQPPSQ